MLNCPNEKPDIRSKLSETSREREGLRSEVGQLETELESMKAKLVGADEKRLEVNHRLAAKEIKIGELEKDVARCIGSLLNWQGFLDRLHAGCMCNFFFSLALKRSFCKTVQGWI